jgi:hypothetical protein
VNPETTVLIAGQILTALASILVGWFSFSQGVRQAKVQSAKNEKDGLVSATASLSSALIECLSGRNVDAAAKKEAEDELRAVLDRLAQLELTVRDAAHRLSMLNTDHSRCADLNCVYVNVFENQVQEVINMLSK